MWFQRRSYDPGRAFRSFWPVLDVLLDDPDAAEALARPGSARHVVVSRIVLATKVSRTPGAETEALLRTEPWHHQLTACVAMLALPPRARSIDAVWDRMRREGPEIPHLLVTAFLVDPLFAANAELVLADIDTFDPAAAAAVADALLALGIDDIDERLSKLAGSDPHLSGDVALAWRSGVLDAYAEVTGSFPVP